MQPVTAAATSASAIDEWIPARLCYQGYRRALATIYRMEAEKRAVTVGGLAKEMELMKGSARAGLTFLKSINVLREEDGSYRLTPSGLNYAHAVSRGSKESVRRLSYDVISSSHLAGVAARLEACGDSLTVEKMYEVIKKEAGIPDYDGPFRMKADHATGVDSLLHIFQGAGIISQKLELEAALEKEFNRVEKTKASSSSEA